MIHQHVQIETATLDERIAAARMVIGRSQAMRDAMTMIWQVAQYPATTVLLQGESGVGKDVVARAIHSISHRAASPFIDINCAAIPETLLETELFGVESGAFTDAKATREGHLQRADGGTLFLDEIGAMPLLLQAKLLRFLETRSFRRVGGTQELHVDVRVVSASNVDLQSAVARHAFRDDLYYRLKVITIYLPPLRERVEDIEPLVEHFLCLHSIAGEPSLCIAPDALELLLQYPWPGNVRQLRSAIQRAQIVCSDGLICPEDLPPEIRGVESNAAQRLHNLQETLTLPPEGMDLRAFTSAIERKFVREALARCDGNQVRAAALLGLSRDQLRYRM